MTCRILLWHQKSFFAQKFQHYKRTLMREWKFFLWIFFSFVFSNLKKVFKEKCICTFFNFLIDFFSFFLPNNFWPPLKSSLNYIIGRGVLSSDTFQITVFPLPSDTELKETYEYLTPLSSSTSTTDLLWTLEGPQCASVAFPAA